MDKKNKRDFNLSEGNDNLRNWIVNAQSTTEA